MEAQKDANGFELQNTVAPNSADRRQSIPTEPPKVPESRNSSHGPPKPTKSSNAHVNGNSKNTASVENGKSKAEEAEEPGIALNLGYFQSWQAAIKITKMLCFIAMLVSMSIPLNGLAKVPKTPRFDRIWDRIPTLQYALAIAVIGLILEITTFVIYILSLNRFVYKFFSPFPFVLIAAHSVMLVFTFVVPIVLNVDEWHGPAITSYVAFDLLVIGASSLDIYFNTMWLTGGSELSRLPCF